MLRERDFYDHQFNNLGNGIEHEYTKQGKVVTDGVTGLMWQQSGSEYMGFEKTKNYVQQLNEERFAGFNDWRLPTLEEAMSLMEPERKKKNDDPFIDAVFDTKLLLIWTADKDMEGEAWIVHFKFGFCINGAVGDNFVVRAVRSERKII